jgi:hypothetical protein
VSAPPLSEPELPPTLDPATAADDDLVEVIDRFIAADAIARERLAWIGFHEELLRQVVEPPAWSLVLETRHLVNEREDHLRVALVRWAFDAGRRFPFQPGQASS